jgi:DNA-binding MarR family transcriptional regulator
MHALLAEFERDGLVARVRDQQDRRRNVVTLTPAGQTALARLDERIDAAQEALLEPLTAAERQELSRLLQKLLQNR